MTLERKKTTTTIGSDHDHRRDVLVIDLGNLLDHRRNKNHGAPTNIREATTITTMYPNPS
jgi:hypothetical protein